MSRIFSVPAFSSLSTMQTVRSNLIWPDLFRIRFSVPPAKRVVNLSVILSILHIHVKCLHKTLDFAG